MNAPAIAIIGDGKMGRTIAQMVQERGWHLTAMLDGAHNRDGVGITRRALGDPDVAIEFTEPASAVGNIMACIHEGVPVVVGTTGWYDSLTTITAAVKDEEASLLWAPNFSVGVTLFVELAREAARIISRTDFAAAMVETHHSAKKDAPSGTALAIAQAMEPSLGKKLSVTSVRTGSVPGTHELIFDAPFEQISMRHEARDRRVFAEGALRAAEWLRGKKGVFTMRDALGFSSDLEGRKTVMRMPQDSKGRALLRGCGTALVTPFTDSGEIDEAALRAFVDWQIGQGIHFVVPCGSTGEAATLTLEEHRRVVEITVDVASGRVPVVAGAGSNDTKKAIALSREMKAAGATHLLHTSPMYNKPPQRGIAAHFRAIADAVDLPLVVYNVPGRTGSNVEAATTIELAQHENITAVKEASGSLAQIAEIIRSHPDNFTVLSGDDALTLAVMAEGGDGVISVTSNVVPGPSSRMVELYDEGDAAGAREINHRLAQWTGAAFIESNPIPAKAALARMGKMKNVLRLPLVSLDGKHAEALESALRDAGALSA